MSLTKAEKPFKSIFEKDAIQRKIHRVFFVGKEIAVPENISKIFYYSEVDRTSTRNSWEPSC